MAQKPKPDTRLDWRDPNMPVIRRYETRDPFGLVIERGSELVAPEIVSKVAQNDLASDLEEELLCGESLHPSWCEDPSYGWGEGRQRKGRKALR